jgi:hypothetical protein
MVLVLNIAKIIELMLCLIELSFELKQIDIALVLLAIMVKEVLKIAIKVERHMIKRKTVIYMN